MIKKIGMMMFFMSLLVALVTSSRFEQGMSPKTLMLTPSYLVGVVLALVGLGLWRRELTKQDGQESRGDRVELADLLESLCTELEKLGQQQDISRDHFLQRLREVKERYIDPFLLRRHELEHKMSVAAGAELQLQFAHGERLLNRAYSCSADGFLAIGLNHSLEAKDLFRSCRDRLAT